MIDTTDYGVRDLQDLIRPLTVGHPLAKICHDVERGGCAGRAYSWYLPGGEVVCAEHAPPYRAAYEVEQAEQRQREEDVRAERLRRDEERVERLRRKRAGLEALDRVRRQRREMASARMRAWWGRKRALEAWPPMLRGYS